MHPERVLHLVAADCQPDLTADPRRASAPASARPGVPSSTYELNVIQPANMWPSGVISVNDSSSAYSTMTPVYNLIPPGTATLIAPPRRARARSAVRRTGFRSARSEGKLSRHFAITACGVDVTPSSADLVGLLPHPAEAVNGAQAALAVDEMWLRRGSLPSRSCRGWHRPLPVSRGSSPMIRLLFSGRGSERVRPRFVNPDHVVEPGQPRRSAGSGR